MFISAKKMPLALTLFIAFLLVACAGRQLEIKPIAKSENPQELINQLDNDIALARKEQVNVLAPDWFAEAESSLNQAKALLEKGDQLSKILADIATGRAQLERAEEIAKIKAPANAPPKLPIPPSTIKASKIAIHSQCLPG